MNKSLLFFIFIYKCILINMKSLKDYIKECEFANPMNTTGIGNPSGPDQQGIASEPIVMGKPHKLKRVKKNK